MNLVFPQGLRVLELLVLLDVPVVNPWTVVHSTLVATTVERKS